MFQGHIGENAPRIYISGVIPSVWGWRCWVGSSETSSDLRNEYSQRKQCVSEDMIFFYDVIMEIIS